MKDLMLFEKKNKVYVNSRTIADKFNKQHFEVIYNIEGRLSDGKIRNVGLINELVQVGGLQVENYFIKSNYTGENGKTYTEYYCTRDGFTLLAMGFAGVKALEFKIEYINAFNMMEEIIRQRQTEEWQITRKQGKLIRRTETDAIQLLIPYAEAQGSTNMRKQAYTIYTKLVNSIIGIEKGQRDIVPFSTLMTIATLEDIITNTILEQMKLNVYYSDIYKKCKENCNTFINMIRPKLTVKNLVTTSY